MIAKFKYYLSSGFLHELFFGEIKKSDLQKITEKQMCEFDFQTIRFILSDVREAEIVLHGEELNEYSENLKAYIKEFKIKWAIISENPLTTALSILLSSDSFFKDKAEVFNTLSAAKHFLNSNLKVDESTNDYVIVD